MTDLGKTHIFKNSSTGNREDDLLWEAKRAANAAKKQTREENQEPNETLQKVKTYTYLALGTVVLAGSLWGGYKVWRRRKDKKEVELAALEYYSADYAIQFAKAFANFGGVGEVLYDVADELLPTFLSEYLIGKDSDWEKVEKIANSMAVDNINEKNTITPNMFAWFEQYTKKEFHDVAKKVLEGNQYDKLLTILAKQKTADFAPNDVSTTQNNAYAWSSGGIVKYDIEVGQMATQHDLKGKIVFIRADAPASVEVKAHFETNANNTKAFLMTFQREGTPSNIAAAGALMGIATGRKIRPDKAWFPDIIGNFVWIEVAYKMAGFSTTYYWIPPIHLAFCNRLADAKLYLMAATNIKTTVKNGGLAALNGVLKNADGSALKGYELTSYEKNYLFGVK